MPAIDRETVQLLMHNVTLNMKTKAVWDAKRQALMALARDLLPWPSPPPPSELQPTATAGGFRPLPSTMVT